MKNLIKSNKKMLSVGGRQAGWVQWETKPDVNKVKLPFQNVVQWLSNPLPLAARTLTLGLVLLVVPFLPACNLFFRVGFVIAERVLYLSSTGYCLLFAYAVGHCCCRWSQYKVGVYAVRLWYLSPHGTKTINKNLPEKKKHEKSKFYFSLQLYLVSVGPLTWKLKK